MSRIVTQLECFQQKANGALMSPLESYKQPITTWWQFVTHFDAITAQTHNHIFIIKRVVRSAIVADIYNRSLFLIDHIYAAIYLTDGMQIRYREENCTPWLKCSV